MLYFGAVLFVLLVVFAIWFLRPVILPGGSGPPASSGAVISFREDEPSRSTSEAAPDSIPDYEGEDVLVLSGNRPNFTEYDRTHFTGEQYSDLDELGRCGPAMALLDRTMMPEEKRGSIGLIKPSGWHTAKYPGLIEDNYLYNRCHLIAYALSGQNDNEKNLITGTRYMNAETMLSYELQVMRYLDTSGGHVLYRVSPLFREGELVARGVEMEALSLEDGGKGLCFHVFVYNRQPGVEIDYRTGESRAEKKPDNADK